MSNRLERREISISLRDSDTPAQPQVWQMQAAPESYAPQRMPMAGNLPEMFTWIMHWGLAIATGAIFFVAVVVVIVKMLLRLA